MTTSAAEGPRFGPRWRVGFLFLGPASHIYHALSIGIALAEFDDVEVTLFVGNDINEHVVRQFHDAGGGRCRIERLEAGWLHDALRLFKKRQHPKIRVVLKHERARLQRFDALVTTNRFLVQRRGGRPLQVMTGHGAGDREHGFSPELAAFDFLLAPGEERLRRLREAGAARADNSVVIGYPKFDLVRRNEAGGPPLFDNDRPVVIYNPHFRPEESSWPQWGEAVLEYFLQHPEFNLVFAPHIILFAKEHDPIPRRFHEAPNILVDYDSPCLVDMTYTSRADIYLGDVSSQVYEFVAYRPRPCVFLNAHGEAWQGNECFRMFRMGEVLESLDGLDAALRRGPVRFPEFEPVQRALVADTFSCTEVPAGRRGALSLRDMLQHPPERA